MFQTKSARIRLVLQYVYDHLRLDHSSGKLDRESVVGGGTGITGPIYLFESLLRPTLADEK